MLQADNHKSYSVEDMVKLYKRLADRFPIVSIEDGLYENDWKGWKLLTDRLGQAVQLVGDDLFVTNVEYLSRGIREGIGTAILIKLNQIGTLTETCQAVEIGQTSWIWSDCFSSIRRNRRYDYC